MTIRHSPEKRRFESEDTNPGVLEYTMRDDGTIVLHHTKVPRELEGKGIGSALAKEAMDYARAHDYRVVVECPFVRSWLERHQEYADIVEES